MQPDLPDIAGITSEARQYGFHATLKPPFRLAHGLTWSDLRHAAQSLAGSIAPFGLPAIAVADLHGFLALREQAPCPAVQHLADRCVAGLDRFRAPPTEAETARRLRGNPTAVQREMIARWGYPYVFEEWFFHMTLTCRLSPAGHAIWRPASEAHFAAALRAPRRVTDICLFVQPTADEPFTIAARFPLRG